MTRLSLLLTAAVTVATLLATGTTLAQTAPANPPSGPPHGQRQGPGGEACKADVERLCKGVQPGGGRIIACLHQNQQSVGPGCAAAMAKAREQREQHRANN